MESSELINNTINSFHNNKNAYKVNVNPEYSINRNHEIIRQSDFIHDIPLVTKRKSFDLDLG